MTERLLEKPTMDLEKCGPSRSEFSMLRLIFAKNIV